MDPFEGAPGLARDVHARSSEPMDRVMDEGGTAPAPDVDQLGVMLESAVERYLSGAEDRREERARRIRDLAGRLREHGGEETIADAVQRLADAGEKGSLQEAPVALAQLLTTPSVAGRLAQQLGAARHEEPRERLVRVCGRLGREMAVALGDALSETDDRAARRTYMDTLIALGADGMAVMSEMVADPRWFVVRNAVLVLGEAGGERAVQHLTMTLAHDDPRVRKETLIALARIGGDDAVMLVPGKLEDPDPDVREAAAMAVGALRIARAERTLLARLEAEEVQDVTVAVLRALGQLGDPGAVQAIEKRAVGSFFSRPPTEIRVAAYRALAAIGTPHAMSLLREAAEDKDPAVKRMARSLLPE